MGWKEEGEVVRGLIAAMIVGHAADLATTWVALGRGCHEMNPIYDYAGFWGLVGIKVLVLAWFVWQANPRYLYVAITFGFGAAAWNMLMMGLGC